MAEQNRKGHQADLKPSRALDQQIPTLCKTTVPTAHP
jgi:hypothetical protein